MGTEYSIFKEFFFFFLIFKYGIPIQYGIIKHKLLMLERFPPHQHSSFVSDTLHRVLLFLPLATMNDPERAMFLPPAQAVLEGRSSRVLLFLSPMEPNVFLYRYKCLSHQDFTRRIWLRHLINSLGFLKSQEISLLCRSLVFMWPTVPIPLVHEFLCA